MDDIAQKLKLNRQLIEQGRRTYQRAQTDYNFIQGRSSDQIGTVCLYIACRLNQTPHLLIDFSDASQVNVYKLGSLYLKLVNKLKLKIPNIDPSIFMQRFSQKLEFEGKTN